MTFYRRCAVLLFLLIAVFANWIYPYREFAQVRQTNVAVDSVVLGTDKVDYSLGGWPWPYYHHFHCDGSSSWFAWNTFCLVGDILFWAMLLIFVWWYAGTRRGNTQGSKTNIRWRWSLIDLLVAMFLFAGLFGYVGRVRSEYAESERLIKVIRSRGGVASESHHSPAWLPNDILLSWILPRDRIAMVSLDNPPSELVREIVALPNLQSLRLGGSGYSLEDLQPLASNPKLTELRLSNCELDSHTIQLIGRLKSLQALNLMHTNVTANDLAALGEMPRLRCVHLGHTDVDLKESKPEPWMQTVRYLRLPRPSKFDSYAFRLDGWPELLDVQCMEIGDEVDASPIKVSLSNAPKLKTLTLIKSQRFDLNLSDLPSFQEIRNSVGVGATEYNSRVWIQSVNFNNLPFFANVKFKILDFQRIRIQNCPRLDCDVDWTNSAERVSAIAAQQMLEGIGKSMGITSLHLTGLPLEQLDLSPIAACSTIKKLNLPIEAAFNPQLSSLSAFDAMEELLLYGANLPLPESTVSELLRIWPSLKRIEGGYQRSIDGRSTSVQRVLQTDRISETSRRNIAVRLQSEMNLESYMKGDYREAPSVALRDLPRYKDSVQVSRYLQAIQIEGTPKLKGLVTVAPWPKDASIDGLAELEIFSAGGPNFQDKDFSGIETSTSLKSLTLGYCGMTAERLSAISKFTKLQSLGLTGSAVSDETVKGWTELRSIRNLMLDRTQISSASIPWICTLRSLQHLSINANCLESVTPEQMVSLSSLQSLFLFGEGLNLEALSGRLNPNLSTLRIENATLTKEALYQLEHCLPKSIRVLDLCNCKADPIGLDEFVSNIPSNIAIGVDGLEVSDETRSFLLSSFRATIEDDGDLFLPNGNNYSSRSSAWPTRSPAGTKSNSLSINTSSSFTVINSIITVVGQNSSTFVKPSLFAPSP